MKRIAAFMLLIISSIAWVMPAKAQNTGALKYAQTEKSSKKAAKDQRKMMKRYAKAQRASAKRANRHTKYRTPSRASLPH
jgi:hypothetical protein